MRLAFVDSSAFLSLEDPDEQAHAEVRAAFERLVEDGVGLLTTNFVFDESYTLLLSRLGRERAIDWGESLRAGRLVPTVRVSEHHEGQAWEILRAYEDKAFSYTDATSFAVCDDLEIGVALSLDRHFRQYETLEVLP